MQPEQKIANFLKHHNKTLCIAESCTGGYLTHRLTNISGSSRFLIASIISYANVAKTKLLQVSPGHLKKDGAVSLAVARQMANHVSKLFKSDFSIAITGIAGPTGGSLQKPVGLVYIAIKSPHTILVQKYLFKGTRIQIKKQAAEKAMSLLLKVLV